MKVYAVVVSVLFFISIVWNVWEFRVHQDAAHELERLKSLQKQYPLLSKRILGEFPQDILINFLPLRQKMRETTKSYGNTFGVYFEYLPTGTSIGINEKNEFYAASLFKLPVVMAYYKGKEKGRGNKIVKIKKEQLDNRFGDLWKKGEGAEISLDEVAHMSLIKSDNTAARVLADNISEEDFKEVYNGLDIDLEIEDTKAIMTAKNYNSILKALYFSSVLEKDHSQEILDTLTRTDFSDKLPAGVLGDIPVAHKIGVVQENDYEAYMDCGIVYAPRRSYSLCMVSTSSEEVARIRMKNMSKLVYSYITSLKQ